VEFTAVNLSMKLARVPAKALSLAVADNVGGQQSLLDAKKLSHQLKRGFPRVLLL
jgi:hypothetical protein